MAVLGNFPPTPLMKKNVHRQRFFPSFYVMHFRARLKSKKAASEKRRYLGAKSTYEKSKSIPTTASKWTKKLCINQLQINLKIEFIMS